MARMVYTTEQEAAMAAAEFSVENESFSVPRMLVFRDDNDKYGYEGVGNSIVLEVLEQRERDGLTLAGEVSAAASGASFLRFDSNRRVFEYDRVLYGTG